MSLDGVTSDTGQGISELFSSYFQSTFLNHCNSNISSSNAKQNLFNNIAPSNSNCDIGSVEINASEVERLLRSLDLTKSAGPDTIPAVFLVNCASELSVPVALLFQRCINEGIMPSRWKAAFISPIHKKGSKDCVEHYRPISKLCLLSKILERIIYTQLYSALKHTFSPAQHGFLKQRSTVSNLLIFSDFVTSNMDNGDQVDAIYTVYSKAFDRIDHCLLLNKLHLAGIRDDMKVFMVVNNAADALCLQEDLCRLDRYCVSNKLDLNVAKCYCVTFSRKRHLFEASYTIKGQNLARALSSRDLGVTYDSKLLFDQHIDHIVSKASKSLGFIMRASKPFKSMKTVKLLYCAYVRSHLEYASQIWNPQYDVYINRLEKIQRKFTRYIGFKFKIPYTDYEHRCERLHLLPLKLRRTVADVIFLFKIIRGYVDCPELLQMVNFHVPTRPSRKFKTLHIPACSTNFRQNFFSLRASNAINSLCNSSEVDIFGSSLETVKAIFIRNFVSSLA
ncbi:uncharacterized protein LOC125490855 [Plutella xylostella]|uniref:uncharacterized protein LOC125490855 n=1 Tax=Plutella xylostella TaxID=51655 RepID=UPI0020325164|nr:uncharacterized protein LOC125490855 [Plutella xylostella]